MPKFAPKMPSMAAIGGSGGCCNCHPITNAAISGTLQLCSMAIYISHAGDLYQNWDQNYPLLVSGQNPDATGGVAPVQTGYVSGSQSQGISLAMARAYLRIHLANTVAIHAVWAVSLVIFVLAFKYYRTALVVPNLVVQFVVMIWQFIFIVIIAATTAWYPYMSAFQTIGMMGSGGYSGMAALTPQDNERLKFIIYTVLLLLIVLCVEIYCAVCIVKFMRYLGQFGGGNDSGQGTGSNPGSKALAPPGYDGDGTV